MKKSNLLSLLFILLTNVLPLSAQSVTTPDLSQVANSKVWNVDNRTVKYDSNSKEVYVDGKPGDGIIWLKDYKFSNGEIEFDVKGKNAPQMSFVGVAFHGIDTKTYDAIYFRPFNFQNSERSSRSVQYISHPQYTWEKLRNDSPGKYENSIKKAPSPDDWFHVLIKIEYPKVTVFVNNDKTHSLQVDQLSKQKQGYVGLWVGNNSDGNFKNLKIRQTK